MDMIIYRLLSTRVYRNYSYYYIRKIKRNNADTWYYFMVMLLLVCALTGLQLAIVLHWNSPSVMNVYGQDFPRRVRNNRIRLPVLPVVSSTVKKMNVSQSPFAPENLVSRYRFDRPASRQPAHSLLSRG